MGLALNWHAEMINGILCTKPDTYERDQMQNGKLCVHLTHTNVAKDAMERHANIHTLSICNMLNITILANDII